MDLEELFTTLNSQDERERRKAAKEIRDLARSDANLIMEAIPKLLDILTTHEDTLTALNMSNTISDLHNNKTSLNVGIIHYDALLSALDKLLIHEMLDTADYMGSAATHLMNVIKPAVESRIDLFHQALPILFKYMKKEHPVKWIAFGMINPVAMRNPIALKDNVEDLFDVVAAGNPQLITPLLNLYKFNPEAYESRFDLLMNIFKTDMTMQSLTLNIIAEIGKKKPNLIIPYLDDFKPGLLNPTTATLIAMLLQEIARIDPDAVYDLIDDMKKSMQFVEHVKFTVPKIYGLLGRASPERAKEMLELLLPLLDDSEKTVKMMILAEFRNLGEMDKTLLDPYMDKIRSYEEDPEQYVRDQANMIIDFYEGRTVRDLAGQIDEQNKKIAEAVNSIDDLKDYVDENIDMLKDFVADIVKKLPLPDKYDTEGRIRKTLILHFACGCGSDRCIYPHDRAFTIESKQWNKWLKVAFTTVKLGKAALIPAVGVGDAVGAIKDIYDIYKTPEQQDYLSYIKEPFLTSEEQDKLVEQLRGANFFQVFNYNSKTAKWCCIMCQPPGQA